ncbi:MAG: HAD family hydrolase [Candidatus Aminicenantes bacterium]|jgi:phosphoserine phosphatase
MKRFILIILSISTLFSSISFSSEEILPSWNDSPAKRAILEFVTNVTNPNSPNFVPPSERIAVFDNDGTLWSEQPLYFQLAFVLDRVKALAPQNPEWKDKQPFKGVLENDIEAVLAGGDKSLIELLIPTHAGMTTGEFEKIVADWIATARHPKTNKLYTEMVYQPMLELLDYMRDNGFKTYIVSGGGIEFMRVFTAEIYGIPPEQVIGSSIKTEFGFQNGKPVLKRLPEIDFIDDKAEKPVGIHKFIGRRPIAAFGNSDGDLQMLQWTEAGERPSLMVYIHHTDAEREWAYDRKSHIGRLDKGLDEAKAKGWTVVDMKNDWKIIYPFELEKKEK